MPRMGGRPPHRCAARRRGGAGRPRSAGRGGRRGGRGLDGWGTPPAGHERRPGTDQRQARQAERAQRGDVGDLRHLPPPISVQQQPPQRLTTEHRLHQTRQLGVVRLRQRLSRQRRIRLARRHVPQMLGDEVISVRLSLLPGQQLLPGVLRHTRDHVRRDLRPRLRVRERRLRREVNLLLSKLAVHRVVHIGGPPQQQATCHRQDHHHSQPRPAKDGEGLRTHCHASCLDPDLKTRDDSNT